MGGEFVRHQHAQRHDGTGVWGVFGEGWSGYRGGADRTVKRVSSAGRRCWENRGQVMEGISCDAEPR